MLLNKIASATDKQVCILKKATSATKGGWNYFQGWTYFREVTVQATRLFPYINATFLGFNLEWSILAVDTQPWHHYCPRSHHTQCPTHCSYRSPLFPHLEYYHLPVAVDQLYKELCSVQDDKSCIQDDTV